MRINAPRHLVLSGQPAPSHADPLSGLHRLQGGHGRGHVEFHRHFGLMAERQHEPVAAAEAGGRSRVPGVTARASTRGGP
jgi:hypothetical protein